MLKEKNDKEFKWLNEMEIDLLGNGDIVGSLVVLFEGNKEEVNLF